MASFARRISFSVVLGAASAASKPVQRLLDSSALDSSTCDRGATPFRRGATARTRKQRRGGAKAYMQVN